MQIEEEYPANNDKDILDTKPAEGNVVEDVQKSPNPIVQVEKKANLVVFGFNILLQHLICIWFISCKANGSYYVQIEEEDSANNDRDTLEAKPAEEIVVENVQKSPIPIVQVVVS